MIKRLKIFIYNLNVSTKVRLFFFFVLFISIITMTVVSMTITRSVVIDNTSNNIKRDISQVASDFLGLDEEVNDCANTFVVNIDNENVDNEDYLIVQDIVDDLLECQLLFKEVSHLTFMDKYGNYITTIGTKDISRMGKVDNKETVETIIQSDYKGNWITNYDLKFIGDESFDYNIKYVKKVRHVASTKDLGYIVLNIDERQLFDIYSNIGIVEGGAYFIVDGQNRILSSNSREHVFTEFDQKLLNGNGDKDLGEMLVFEQEVSDVGWTIYCTVPVDKVTEKVDRMGKQLLLLSGIIIFLALLSSIQLSKSITTTLTKLTQHIKNSKEGVFRKYEQLYFDDEIGVLVGTYNDMIERNQNLQNRIDENIKKRREYELALLQLQIKPHFLYNTFDIINRLVALDRKEQALGAIRDISKFYRLSLSKGNEIISLKEEFEITEKYLSIQKLRYPNVFEYKVEIIESMENYLVPKFTIQPLVENSIYHGLKGAKKKGLICVAAVLKDGDILLTVSDDGVGIDKKRIDTVLNNDDEITEKKSYGTSNVNERIKLYYGENYGIEIDSEVGVGTTITIKLKPVIKVDEMGGYHV